MTDAWNKIAKSFKCSPIEGECLWTFGSFIVCDCHRWTMWIDLVDSCIVYRHAVPSAQTTCNWWGENNHPKSNRPAKVCSFSQFFLLLLNVGGAAVGESSWSVFFLFVFFVERTMRRPSLRCMRYMQWMCLSALERGRWEQIWYKFVLDFYIWLFKNVKAIISTSNSL